MEIIAELEQLQRGPYCGSIGYIGFDGTMDLSITIRTLAAKDNKVCFQVGGGIVADSTPFGEFQETETKAVALTKALL
jgi:para-aminobenzoate synthetase component 1